MSVEREREREREKVIKRERNGGSMLYRSIDFIFKCQRIFWRVHMSKIDISQRIHKLLETKKYIYNKASLMVSVVSVELKTNKQTDRPPMTINHLLKQ